MLRTMSALTCEWFAATIFRDQGMRRPEMRMRMIDGFNEGWIDFRDPNAERRKGRTGIDEAIAGLLNAGAER